MRLKLILALTAGIAGCSSALADDDQGKMPTIQSDERTVEVRGPSLSDVPFGNSLGDGTYAQWFLRSFVDKHTHVAVQHQLYAFVVYTAFNWVVLETARTDDGQPLSVRSIDKRSDACVNYCRYSETVAVELPEVLLRDREQTGFHVKILARIGGGYVDLRVTSEMIQKQLTALAEAEKLP